MSFKGKRVLVTGSTRGIGLSIMTSFIDSGAKVIFNSRTESELQELQKKYPEHLYFCGDMSSTADCSKLSTFIKEKLGGLDVAVFNVGSGKSVPPGEETKEEWERVLSLNLLTATTPVSALKETIIQNKANLVFISSICGLEALGAPLSYSAAKAALNSFVVGLAKAWGQHGVRVNAVVPGNILFTDSTWDKKLKDNKSAVEEMLKKEVALNRLGKAEEVADAVHFLASSKASFITGSLLVVDGGQVRGV